LVGDDVPVRLAYRGFNPLESVTLFYSFVKATGEERPIMQRDFTTSSTGQGAFEASWVVPWDEFYALEWPQREAYIVVRASPDMSQAHPTDRMSVRVFTDTDGIFERPGGGEVVVVAGAGTDTSTGAGTGADTGVVASYEVKWDAALLTSFVPGMWNSPFGRSAQGGAVALEMCGERYNGSAYEPSFRQRFNGTYANTGSAVVGFSAAWRGLGERFYVRVSVVDRHFAGVGGWSKGYFRFATDSYAAAGTGTGTVAVVAAASSAVTDTTTAAGLTVSTAPTVPSSDKYAMWLAPLKHAPSATTPATTAAAVTPATVATPTSTVVGAQSVSDRRLAITGCADGQVGVNFNAVMGGWQPQ
jgi:hypothetical protein